MCIRDSSGTVLSVPAVVSGTVLSVPAVVSGTVLSVPAVVSGAVASGVSTVRLASVPGIQAVITRIALSASTNIFCKCFILDHSFRTRPTGYITHGPPAVSYTHLDVYKRQRC